MTGPTVLPSHARKIQGHFFDYVTAASFQMLYNPSLINNSTTDDKETEVLRASLNEPPTEDYSKYNALKGPRIEFPRPYFFNRYFHYNFY
jgi:hypothetical protein